MKTINSAAVFLFLSFSVIGQTKDLFTNNNCLVNEIKVQYHEVDFGGNLKNICDSLLKLEKSAIPLLIEEIDDPGLFLGAHMSFPYNSILSIAAQSYNFTGILSAYFIDFILSRDPANKPNLDTIPYNTAKDFAEYSWYYLSQGSNLIVKRDTAKELTYSDIKYLQKLYQVWWHKNSQKTIKQLRKEYVNHPILEGTNFKWI